MRRALILFVALALLPAVTRAYCQNPSTGAGLKLLTYNVAMVDTGFQTNQDLFGMGDDARAIRIVNGIFRDDADVVILNEAFNEEGMDKFVELLKGKYPSYVRMVDERDSSDADSGLMLFSKFKFAPVPCETGCVDAPGSLVSCDLLCGRTGTYVEAYNEGIPWNHYNARLLATNGSDAWANKAAALIRIVNECDNNTPFTVVFTHTQASYKDTDNEEDHEDFVDRQRSFALIKGLITKSLTPEELSRERVFVLGDLNVNGNLLNAEKVADGKGGTEDFIEWDYTFGQYARDKDIHDEFFACKGPTETCTFDTTKKKGPYLVDSWGYETSPADPGQTNSGSDLSISLEFPLDAEGERLDYILHNKPSGDGLCMQWIARAYELNDLPAWSQLSDHMGVKADFNRPFARCTPREKNVPGGGGANGSEPVKWKDVDDQNFTQDITFSGDDTRIKFPGSMQWYIVDEKGTFSIATSKNNVAFEVYQEKNLSRPVNFFGGEMTAWGKDPVFIGKTYKFSEPPYYVRVFPVKADGTHDRSWADSYTISFHKHMCKSLEDKCLLRAGELEEFEWPDTLLKPEDKLFYRFYADTLSSGKAPKIQFFIETSTTTDSIPTDRVELLTADAATAIPWFHMDSSWSDSGPVPNGKKDMRFTAPDTVKGDPCAQTQQGCSLRKPFTLRVSRADTFQKKAFTLGIRYETSLNYFRATNLVCVKQNTDVGDDDTWENFKFDMPNAAKSACLGDPGCTLIGWFDTGKPLGISHLRGKYEDNVVPNLWEDEDNPGEGGHEYLSPLEKKFIGPLPVDFFKKGVGKFRWGTWPGDVDESLYWYEMTYEVSHEPEEVQ